ncbi:MAG: hypothetical protein ACRDAW_02210, partial [Metamycoplasmataceae bacterium]
MNKKLLISLGALSTIAIVSPILITASCAAEVSNANNLVVTAIANPKLTNEDVIVLENATADNTAKWNALAKLFTGAGFVEGNKDKFTSSIDKTNSTVTIKANTGYTINGGETFASNKYIIEATTPNKNLAITAIANPKLTDADMAVLENATVDNTAKWNALAKLFAGEGFVVENKDNFTSSIDKGKSIVTLKANPGYTINGGETFASNVYAVDPAVPNKDLVITTLIDPKVTEEEINSLEVVDNNETKLTSLTKLFQGNDLNLDNLANLEIKVDKVKFLVTLTGINGYTINAQTSLVSNRYLIITIPTITDLKITANGAQKLRPIEETAIKGTDPVAQLSVLQKLFTGITSTNQPNFTVAVSDTNVVTLT